MMQTQGAAAPSKPIDPSILAANAAVDQLIRDFIEYGLVLVTVATVVMAFLELFKAVSRARLRFHRRCVRAWIRRARADREEVIYRELLMLAASDVQNENGLFDQSTDKMMGQIQAATTVAMNFPDRYRAFFEFLTFPPEAPASTEGSRLEGEEAVAEAARTEPTSDQDRWRRYVRGFETNPTEMLAAASTDRQSSAEGFAANSARSRLDHYVARKLDAFQSSVEYDWARANQVVAVLGSAVFLMVVLQDVEPDWVKRAVVSIFGGMIAPFAKDFVTALQRLRR